MLLKNGERYTITPEDIKQIKRKFPKFPIRLKYPDNRIKKNPKNMRPDEPASISIPLVATVKTDSAIQEWRYAEGQLNLEGGLVKYTPHNLLIQGKKVIQETDMELIYWLLKACPHLEGGKNFNGKVAKIAFEDLLGKAQRAADEKAEKAEIHTLIYSKNLGMGEDKLKLVSKAYFIRGVDDMSLPQIQIALETEINRDKLSGVKKFLEIINAEQVLKVKAKIQTAIDHKVILFNRPKKTWQWVTEEGKRNETITSVGMSDRAIEDIYNYYNGDANFAEQLTKELISREIISPEEGEE